MTLRLVLAALVALVLGACGALPSTTTSTTSISSASTTRPHAVEVAPGVYLMQGQFGEPDPSNLGRIGNAGFVVGPTGVLAIDTGTSYRHGSALLDEIRRVTDQPVRAVVITQAHQEFLFGAMAYRGQGIPIRMHRRAAQLMRSRCERCLRTLNEVVGTDAMFGTAMFTPDVEFDAAQTIELIGRPVRVLDFDHSAGPGDVALFVPDAGVLFAGGLIDAQRVPDVQDGDLAGWHAALKDLRTLPIRVVVPGHGPASGARVIDDVDRYLAQLQQRIQQLLQSGTALSEVPDAASLPEYTSWDQYETIHRRNASVLYVRFEREQLLRRAAD